MKKLFFLIFVLSCLANSMFGQSKASSDKQQQVYITFANGQRLVKNVWEIESITFGEDENVLTSTAPTEAIDLGLSVKWSPFNLGASSPNSTGFLVGWGDTTGQNKAVNNKYFPSTNPSGNITNTSFDIVKLMWEDEWRLPTSKEVQELIDNCNWTWEETDERTGFLVSSKTDETKEIFLPVTGIRKGTLEPEKLKEGFYWTGNIATDNQEASFLHFWNRTATLSDTLRYLGLAIRPVYGKLKQGVTLTAQLVGTPGQNTAQISIDFKGDLNEITEYGVLYGLDANVMTSKKVLSKTAPTTESLTATLDNLEMNTTYYYTVYAVYDNTYVYSDNLSFTTDTKFKKPTEAVDLGLSVKWSPWNMGAKNADDEGLYLAWGDPTGETPNYSFGSTTTNISGTNMDIAHVNWGGKWRMPTMKELEELTSLEWTFEAKNGIKGWNIMGKNGNSIWIPLHGAMISGSLKNSNVGYYWAGQTDDSLHPGMFQIYYGNNCESANFSDKTAGMFIRPVYDESGSSVDPTEPETGRYVDLGLSCYWADCNLGANAESEIGDYYAWGETSSKANFSNSNYAFTDPNGVGGYQTIGTNGITIANTEYDVVKAKMGGKWHMPTYNEILELIETCTWEITTVNGQKGYKVTGKNGNHIFLPYSGYKTDKVYSDGNAGFYWSGSLYEFGDNKNEQGSSLAFSVNANGPYSSGRYRYQGCPIRPVRTK